MGNNSPPGKGESSTSRLSRRTVLRGAAAAGVAGTGVLAQSGISTRVRGGCNDDLGSSIGSQCDQDYWSRGGRDTWENCGNYDTYDHYEAYLNNFNVSWTDQQGSNYYFSSASGAQAYWAEEYFTDEMCNDEGDYTMLNGSTRIDGVSLSVNMSGHEAGTQLVTHTDYIKAGGMDHDEWETWVENNEGQDPDSCQVQDKFESEDYNDTDVPYWEQGVALGLSAAIGTASLVGGIAVGALPMIAQMAGEARTSRTLSDGEDYLDVSWDVAGLAQLSHSAKFNVDMSPDQSQDVYLDITQSYSLDETGKDNSSAYTTYEYTIVIPPNSCDPYVQESCFSELCY